MADDRGSRPDQQVGEVRDDAEGGEAAEQLACLGGHGLMRIDLDPLDLHFDAFDLLLQPQPALADVAFPPEDLAAQHSPLIELRIVTLLGACGQA